MESIFDSAILKDVHSDLIRNIVSLRVSQNLFDDLTDDEDAWKSAIKLELDTKPKLFNSTQPVIDRPFEEAEWNNAIGYPFKNASNSRYSDGSYGVWYGADSIETTVHETAFHWKNCLLEDAGFTKAGIAIERRIYLVQCDSALIDLRSSIKKHPEICHPSDYTMTHTIGSKLHREGHPGLITHSARCQGDVYAIFRANVLTNPRHSCYLTYVTTNHGIEIQKTPSKPWMIIH